jgi:hypothetical protein
MCCVNHLLAGVPRCCGECCVIMWGSLYYLLLSSFLLKLSNVLVMYKYELKYTV